jgi:hypothetical protein
VAGDLFFEQGGFDGPGAAQVPVRGVHFLDHAELDFVSGLKDVDVMSQANQEVLARFVLQNDAAAAQAVNDSIFRGTELYSRGGRAFSDGAVGFRRLNSSK